MQPLLPHRRIWGGARGSLHEAPPLDPERSDTANYLLKPYQLPGPAWMEEDGTFQRVFRSQVVTQMLEMSCFVLFCFSSFGF